ncbi:MAG TPA: ferritin [Syntrophomonadaceae bacterium]|jgi:ferritin|nr:ferritin [Syntrophomonadaceae bacterium]
MIKQNLADALNKQINAELYSAYLYLSMAAYCENISLKGFAHWMRMQTKEEVAHAMHMYEYLAERGGRIMLETIAAPPTEWESPLDMFTEVYAHEQKVTGLINDLVNLAQDERDHALYTFLQWYVSEQVEEEASADEIVQQLKLMGQDNPSLLFMLDRELGQRVFVDPFANQA